MQNEESKPTKKWCCSCKQVKPIEDFDTHVGVGRVTNGRRKICKECLPIIQPVLDAQRETRNAEATRFYDNHPEKRMYTAAKSRAKEKELPFNIEVSDIVIPEKCPVLGIPLFKGSGPSAHRPNSPSLDRIIPNLGYIKGNVTVISFMANTMKQNATLEQCVMLGEYAARQIVARDFIAQDTKQ